MKKVSCPPVVYVGDITILQDNTTTYKQSICEFRIQYDEHGIALSTILLLHNKAVVSVYICSCVVVSSLQSYVSTLLL